MFVFQPMTIFVDKWHKPYLDQYVLFRELILYTEFPDRNSYVDL